MNTKWCNVFEVSFVGAVVTAAVIALAWLIWYLHTHVGAFPS